MATMLDSATLMHQLELPVAALPSEETLGQRRGNPRGSWEATKTVKFSSAGASIWFSGFSFLLDWKHPIRVRGRHDGRVEIFSKKRKTV